MKPVLTSHSESTRIDYFGNAMKAPLPPMASSVRKREQAAVHHLIYQTMECRMWLTQHLGLSLRLPQCLFPYILPRLGEPTRHVQHGRLSSRLSNKMANELYSASTSSWLYVYTWNSLACVIWRPMKREARSIMDYWVASKRI